jgi:putative sterol carrier protein
MSVEWEEPPPPPTKQPDFVAELKANPDRWAVIAICKVRSTAAAYVHRIRTGGFVWSRPAASFEAVYRKVEDEFRVYARYVGGAR